MNFSVGTTLNIILTVFLYLNTKLEMLSSKTVTTPSLSLSRFIYRYILYRYICMCVCFYIYMCVCVRVYSKFSGLATWSKNCKCYSSLHYVQLYRYFPSQSSEFCRHNPLCCFSTSVYLVSIYFIIDPVRKLLDTPSCVCVKTLKITVYKAIVLSVVLHGCETSPLALI